MQSPVPPTAGVPKISPQQETAADPADDNQNQQPGNDDAQGPSPPPTSDQQGSSSPPTSDKKGSSPPPTSDQQGSRPPSGPATPPPAASSPPPSSPPPPPPTPPPPVSSPPPAPTSGSPPSPPPPVSSPPPAPTGGSPPSPPPSDASSPPPSDSTTPSPPPPLPHSSPSSATTPPTPAEPVLTPPPPAPAAGNAAPVRAPAPFPGSPPAPVAPGVIPTSPQKLPGAPGRPLPSPSQPTGTPGVARPGTEAPPSSKASSTSNNTMIIGAVILAGAMLIAFVGICLVCSKKKKKQPYYMDPAGRTPQGSQPSRNSPNPMDHIVKLRPPAGMMGAPIAQAPVWGGPPPNPSGEFSSGLSGHNNQPSASPNMGLGGFNKSQFWYEELAAATGGFSQANVLGQGGFGFVHKGVLSDGKEVAVKSLKSGSGQGEREFQAEVEIISRVHHRHLVSLVGYCISDGQRMLVYEFVPNKTLEYHLHGKGQPVMSWEIRLRIALGSAKGLAYLHEDCHPKIIHRDIKAANILLDDKYEAMVADFGLAKLSSDNFTHVSTRVMGTFGYMAPEYASSGKLTEKSDVFSFGVMLLELITGRIPVDPTDRYMEDSLVDWARPLLTKALEDGDYSQIADPRLEGNYVAHEMARMIACASASIRHSNRKRPKMSQIVRTLEGDSSLEDLNDAKQQCGGCGSDGSSVETQTYDTGMYNADMNRFRKMIMSSQEFNSSDFGATGDYGLHPSSSSSDSREYGDHQKTPKL